MNFNNKMRVNANDGNIVAGYQGQVSSRIARKKRQHKRPTAEWTRRRLNWAAQIPVPVMMVVINKQTEHNELSWLT